MIVAGVVFPHRTRFVTFSFQKLEEKKKLLRYLRERSAVVGILTPQQQFSGVRTGRDDLFYHLFIHVRAVTHVT